MRNRVIENLIPATHYQFRICAENRMGRGNWSMPSVLVSVFLDPYHPIDVTACFHCCFRLELSLVFLKNLKNQQFVM
jgi:hypothetical protein